MSLLNPMIGKLAFYNCETKTCTFDMENETNVLPGEYAIVPIAEYSDLLAHVDYLMRP